MKIDLEQSVRRIDIDEETKLKQSRNIEIEHTATEDDISIANEKAQPKPDPNEFYL